MPITGSPATPPALPFPSSRALGAGLIAGAALATVLAAQVRIPVPGSPVPVTLQTLTALLAGGFLGARAGAAAMALYVGLGSAGLPVFAAAQAGPVWSAPTGGYLLGLVAAAWIAGRAAERGFLRGGRGLFALAVAGAAVHACGLPWLALFLHAADPAAPLSTVAARTLSVGLVPFVAGDALKVALASAVLPAARAVARRDR